MKTLLFNVNFVSYFTAVILRVICQTVQRCCKSYLSVIFIEKCNNCAEQNRCLKDCAPL